VSTWDLAEAITGGLRGVLGGQWQEGEYRSGELEEAAWLESERYGNDEWTWRQ